MNMKKEMVSMLNSNVIVPDIDKLSYAEWLQVRCSGIGGSDAAAA